MIGSPDGTLLPSREGEWKPEFSVKIVFLWKTSNDFLSNGRQDTPVTVPNQDTDTHSKKNLDQTRARFG
jgi:hypothetical protein